MLFSMRAVGVAVLAAGLGLSALGAASAADEPGALIKYRTNVMRAIGSHIGNIAAVIKGDVSRTDHLARDGAALAEMTRDLTTLFPEGSGDGETRALPEIWTDWDKFKAAAKTVTERAEALSVATAGGDMAAIGAALGALGKGCGGCHKPFRKEK